MNLLAELRSRCEAALRPFCDDPATFAALVKPAQDRRFGDYQANFAMPLAKQRGGNPKELAAQIVAALDVADLCEAPDIAGPGFINFKLRQDWLQAETRRISADERLGVPPVATPRNIVIDYSAPNVAKPMHVGHLRSTVIGGALYEILRFLGHKVISDNHIGDWGTQFGMIIYGYKNFLDRPAFEKDAVGELSRLYRLVNQLCDYHEAVAALPAAREKVVTLQRQQREQEEAPAAIDKEGQAARKKTLKRLSEDIKESREEVERFEKRQHAVDSSPPLKALAETHPRIAVASREETAKLHAGDAENLRLWEQFIPQCLAALQGLYNRLGVRFDQALGESFYQPMLADVVADMQARGLASESNGAICIFIPGIEAPFIIRKTDGAFTYATTDLATIKYRVDRFQAEIILYVVDARQSDHFKLLFEAARRWGYTGVELRHVSFGTILGKDKRPFKTRAGDTVGLESLLDEAIVEARKITDASTTSGDLPESERARIAEIVGLGAIKYADLSQNRESDYEFSWEKMLALNGDTATYMQYAYARVCGIFRRGGIDRRALREAGGEILLSTPADRDLAFQLNRFSEALAQAAAEYRPNFLTAYLYETANCFSTFFEQAPVLKADSDALRTSRLLLADLTARVIAKGLDLLGIQTIDQM